MPIFQNGKYEPRMVAGSEMRQVDFYLDDACSFGTWQLICDKLGLKKKKRENECS